MYCGHCALFWLYLLLNFFRFATFYLCTTPTFLQNKINAVERQLVHWAPCPTNRWCLNSSYVWNRFVFSLFLYFDWFSIGVKCIFRFRMGCLSTVWYLNISLFSTYVCSRIKRIENLDFELLLLPYLYLIRKRGNNNNAPLNKVQIQLMII